jgi:hypothetical protein
MITRDRLVELFTYDAEYGYFYRKSRDKKQRPTKTLSRPAGHLKPNGYVEIRVDRKIYPAGHLVWLWETGSLPDVEIDHKDLNPSNNCIGNIRPATTQQNCLNRGLRSDSQTGFKGVKRCPDGRFMVRIVIDGERQYLGLYDSAEEACCRI